MPKRQSVLERLLHYDRDIGQVFALSSSASSAVERRVIIGADEVGRGSLISSVVASAVAFPETLSVEALDALSTLNDSKQLSAKQRKPLFEAIQRYCRVATEEASQEEVDALNVHHASLLALSRAVKRLCLALQVQPEQTTVLIDGRTTLPDFPCSCQKAIVKGDTQSAAIAAASVVAKETRDAFIRQLAEGFPGYGWERNMGYGTAQHLLAIKTLGSTVYHRKRFLTKLNKTSAAFC